jgi:hypothetical protein
VAGKFSSLACRHHGGRADLSEDFEELQLVAGSLVRHANEKFDAKASQLALTQLLCSTSANTTHRKSWQE